MAADNYSDVVQVMAQQIVEVCMQAIKKSMPSLIAGATINADQIEGEVSNVNTTNLAVTADHVQGLTPYINSVIGGSSINVSNLVTVDKEGVPHQIATYNPDTNTLSIDTLNVTTAQVADFAAQYAELWMAEIGKASVKLALIDELSAGIATIADAQIGQATIDAAQITALEAVSAKIADAFVQNASIDFAQVKDLSAGTAIIEKGLNGKLYVADLAVTDANMVNLTVGELIVKDDKGQFCTLVINSETGQVTGVPAPVDTLNLSDAAVTGDKIANGTINGDTKIIESSITARTLNVQDIFAENAMVLKLIAQNINVDELFANSAFINKLNTTDISSNTSLQLAIQQVYDETMREVAIRLSDDRIIATVTGSKEFSDTINERTHETVTSYYAINDNGTEPPEEGWETEIPEAGNGDYLWTKTVTQYGNGQEPSVVYTVSMFGVRGADGIVLKLTSDIGTIYREDAETMTLTADVYAAGQLLNQAETLALGGIQWFRNGTRLTNLGSQQNWHQITISLDQAGTSVIYSAKLMG